MRESHTTSLREVATPRGLIGGPFGSSLVGNDYVTDGVPVIRGTNLIHGRYVAGDFVYVSGEKANRDLARNLAMPGDLIFTQRGTLGQVAMIPAHGHEAYVVSQSQMRLRVDPAVADSRFVYYGCSMASFLRQISDNSITTGVPHINLGILSRLTIELPPLRQQTAIAEVLGALDDKIAANSLVAKVARELAESHFRLIMSTATDVSTVGSVLSLSYGKPLPAVDRIPGDVLVYGSGGVVGRHNAPLALGPGVVVGRKGTAGAVHWAPGPFFPIDTTFYVVPKSELISPVFCYFALKSLRLEEMNSDSAVPGLNRADAEGAVMMLPEPGALRAFTDKADALLALATQADRESDQLAATRDILLPPLVSGRLGVRDAERVADLIAGHAHAG